MKFRLLLALLFGCSAWLAAAEETYPTVSLRNQQLEATLYLPDARHGYYRSCRFDWSSMVAGVVFDGHRYFGDFITPHDPMITDAASGIAEEFTTPLGYEEAADNETFLKIGAGVYRRPDREAYRSSRVYQLVSPPDWSEKHGADWIEFSEQAAHGPYAYRYTRRIELSGATIIVRHTLTNQGREPIRTAHYAHNFIHIDDQPIGAGYSLSHNFRMMSANKWPQLLQLQDNGLSFCAGFPDEQARLVFPAGGWAKDVAGFSAEVYHELLRAGILIETDFPLSSYLIFANQKALCPEPTLDLQLAGGEQRVWSSRYTFYNRMRRAFSHDDLVRHSLSALRMLTLDGTPLPEFHPEKDRYGYPVFAGQARLPQIEAFAFPVGSTAAVTQATPEHPAGGIRYTPPETKERAATQQTYSIEFRPTPVQSVFASTSVGSSPMSTLDGDLDTSWATGTRGAWIRYEFPSAVELAQMSIAWVGGQRRKFQYEVAASVDGAHWTRLYEGWSSGTTTELEAVPLPKRSVLRYLRITGFGNTQSEVTNIADVAFSLAGH